jgi:hypothetical protein
MATALNTDPWTRRDERKERKGLRNAKQANVVRGESTRKVDVDFCLGFRVCGFISLNGFS